MRHLARNGELEPISGLSHRAFARAEGAGRKIRSDVKANRPVEAIQ
ncbi:hypothetical protein LRP30_32180 [Bradyrhizobium sp. C-145]|nr:hypothetical protein [Bradyrhizobium sp. C-145]UQR61495.1 hypothetical protein LRP30_32180 [Bradyrhizobium sp. C-145]